MPRRTFILFTAILLASCKKLPEGSATNSLVDTDGEKAQGTYLLQKDENRGPSLCTNDKLDFDHGTISKCTGHKKFGNPNGKYECDGFTCRLAGHFIFDDTGGDWLKLVYYLKAEDIIKISGTKFKANSGDFCLSEFEVRRDKDKITVHGCSTYENNLDPNGTYKQIGKISEEGVAKFRKALKDGSFFELIAEGGENLPYMMTFQIENRFIKPN